MINPSTLRHRRTLAGLSQRGLARVAGLGPLGIKRIEDGADAGRLPLAVVGRIADAVGVTINQLLAEPPNPTSSASDVGLAEPQPLTYHQAKLLRRLQRGEDIIRRLTGTDRELTIPSMLKAGLVDTTATGILCSDNVTASLAHPSM